MADSLFGRRYLYIQTGQEDCLTMYLWGQGADWERKLSLFADKLASASGNITQMDDIIKNKPANFNVISGDDGITFPLITLGAVGVISVIGNAFPREFSRMVRLALAGDYDSARTIHHSFTELFSLLFIDGNPAGAKSMLNAMGFIENKLRLPLVPTRITTFEKIRDVLRQLSIKG